MWKFRSLFLACAALVLGPPIGPAQAQIARTFVSALSGSDANNCDRPTPCRTFQHAHDNTLANGEITVLDPGGYGAVMITKNISIINDGVGEAGVLVSGGATGITVNAPGAAVTLRGLTIKGIGFGGGGGITLAAAHAVTVENSAIRNMSSCGILCGGDGIAVTSSTATALAVTNTVVSDNSNNGILFLPTVSGSTLVTGVLDHVGLYNNGGAGLSVIGAGSTGGRITVMATDSVAANNGTPGNLGGFVVQSSTGAAITFLHLSRCTAVNNPGNGALASGTPAIMLVNTSVIQFNDSGWVAASGAQIFTYGDNELGSNNTNQGAQTSIGKL